MKPMFLSGSRLVPTLSAVVLCAVLGACSSIQPIDSGAQSAPPVRTATVTPEGAGTPAQSAVTPVAPTQPTAPVDPTAGLAKIVYFDFDSFVIKDEFRPVVDGHAKLLTGNAGRRMVVEGHTDERGSTEYNLALGQKRAESVVKALTLLGAKPEQLEAVSYGEERPADEGHDEAAWGKNRRAELKDR